MAYGFTSYAPYPPEEEDLLALLGGYDTSTAELPPPEPMLAQEPAALPLDAPPEPMPEPVPQPIADPAAVPAADAEPDDEEALSPLEQLAQRYASGASGTQAAQPQRAAPQLPAPPMREGTPKWALGIAGVLDLLLNKGRNAGNFMAQLAGQDDDVAYDNYRRQVDAATAQSRLDNAYAYGGRRAGGPNGDQLALQAIRAQQAQERLRLQAKKIREQAARNQQLRTQWDELHKAGSPTHQALLVFAAQQGFPVEQIANLPTAQAEKILDDYVKNAGVVGEAREGQAAETAGAVSKATLEDRIAIAREGAIAREEAEGQSPAFLAQQGERYRAAADQYAKETDRYRGVAQQVQRSRTVLEKYKGKDLPGLGIMDGRIPDAYFASRGDTDALELRNAQRLMNDLVLRAQTGAAAPLTEQQQVQIMTGSKPGSTETEFMIGLQAMEEYATGQLRAFSAGKEDAARDVLRRQDLEGAVFPSESKPKRAKRKGNVEIQGKPYDPAVDLEGL